MTTRIVLLLAVALFSISSNSQEENESDATVKNSIGMKLKRIEKGTFLMGKEIKTKASIKRAFYLGVTEVTQGEWKEVMGTRPWHDKMNVKEGPEFPATFVSWIDAVQFCERLTLGEGVTYRLPSEAEWEYGCRAGSSKKYCFGDDEDELGQYAWFIKSVGKDRYAHPVRMKRANDWGLHDMHGNVFEWVVDDATSGIIKVHKGGGWIIGSDECCSGDRFATLAHNRNSFIGFRVVRELHEGNTEEPR